jgi:alpha,alpha-trehalose phosphorylase
MIKHKLVLPPEHIYPIDDWRIVEQRFVPRFLPQMETIFSLANGYLGMRGTFEEGLPAFQPGTFINGFYESWLIPYGEGAYGYAKTGQTIINVPDSKIIRLYVDDEPFDVGNAIILRFMRVLDLRAGTLDREVLWETPSGRQLLVQSRRLISFHEKHVAAIMYRVSVLNTKASLVISSEIFKHSSFKVEEEDPREARVFEREILLPRGTEAADHRIVLSYVANNSGMSMACGIDHRIETNCRWTSEHAHAEETGKVVFLVDAEPDQAIELTKFITYHTSRSDKTDELRVRAGRTLDRIVTHGFSQLLADQRAYLDDFWDRSDIQIKAMHPRIQQSIRWNLFQLLQAAGRADYMGIPAKGLTGQAYEGHYFWDMDMYMLPFFVYTSPRLALNILRYRYSILDKARQRAHEVSQRGALYPWRTINGEEASANYASGTAQYHINAAVAYGLRKYVEITGDYDFLYRYGAEMLVETARLWYDLGFFSERQNGQFCIHGVTGPDEYTTVVNNNTYTNLMAQDHLRYAAAVVEQMRAEAPEHFRGLAYRTNLDPQEVQDWQRAADAMYIPFDERLGIHPQDDSFLDREVWDFANTPEDKYPLLLNYHPLVIYRHQVIKQADIVLAMVLLGDEFTIEQKQRNFDYYDPFTTGDSSLSACIQSIVAAEIGYYDKADQYLLHAVLMDVANVGGNVESGCHIASMGGTWMAIVYGMAGMHDQYGQIRFNPRPDIEKLRFPLTVRGQRLEVDIENGRVTYLLRQGEGLTIWHRDDEIHLSEGQAVSRNL